MRPSNVTGWASTPSDITGGTIDFNLGSVAADTRQIAANFSAYNGSPDFQVNGTDINTLGNQFRSFTTTLDVSTSDGEQVVIRIINNLASSPTATYTSELNGFIIFRS